METNQDNYRIRKIVAQKENSGKVPISARPIKDLITPSIPLSNLTSAATFSVSADANRSDNLSTTTYNTLSMISTPWTTESGFSFSKSLSDPSKASEHTSYKSWTKTEDSLTSKSTAPRSTMTSGVRSPTLGSFSKTTVTLYNFAPTPCHSNRIHVPTMEKSRSQDSISWTLESFTSPGLASNKSFSFRVKYPWSPATLRSGTEYYPNSLDTLASRKGSRVSMTPKSSSKKDIHWPMNYMTMNSKIEEDPVLDWTLAKQNGIPVVCTANMIDTRV